MEETGTSKLLKFPDDTNKNKKVIPCYSMAILISGEGSRYYLTFRLL